MWVPGKRLAVFSIRHDRGGSVWVRAGTAFCNKDGSFNVVLDVMPLNGRLHIRDVMERKPPEAQPELAAALANTTSPSDASEPSSSEPQLAAAP